MPKIERPGYRRIEVWVPDELLVALDVLVGARGRNAAIVAAIAQSCGIEYEPPKLGRPSASPPIEVKPAKKEKPARKAKKK